MNIKKSFLLSIVGFILSFFILVGNISATSPEYTLSAPQGTLTRGQELQFTIDINPNGNTMKSAQVGMTYVTNVLEYISTTPGNTFTTVETEKQDGGKLVFKASNDAGVSQAGTFAVVTFKLIATSAGETELCVLYDVETPTPTIPPEAPRPTALPKSGSTTQTGKGIFFGLILLIAATSSLILANYKPYKTPKNHTSQKTLH